MARGSCLCGAVTYVSDGPARSVVACHCNQCRKATGHFMAATQVPSASLKVSGVENMSWFKSSESAERGFCKVCGSQMFWREFDSGNTSITAGTIDGPSGLKLDRQLFAESKGDYYDLPIAEDVDQSTL